MRILKETKLKDKIELKRQIEKKKLNQIGDSMRCMTKNKAKKKLEENTQRVKLNQYYQKNHFKIIKKINQNK